MKRLLFPLLFLGVAFVCAAGNVPRLLFTEKNVAHLKTPEGRRKVVELAERGGKNRIEAWSLAYRVTGDKKYAEKVREKLRRECLPPNAAPWSGGLGGAHKCYEMGLGFDSIRDTLSPEERKAIASGIVTRGIEPMLAEWLFGRTRTTTLDSMGHNWWSACVFLPGFAALAVSDEEPRVLPYLERIKTATKEWFEYPGSGLNNKPATFDREGGFYESVGYGNYALSTYLTFHTAWKSARSDALPEIPLLDRVGDFFLNSCYPSDNGLLSLNFGDPSLHADGSRPLVWLRVNGLGKPRHLWYLAQTANSSCKEAIPRNSPLGLVFYPSAEELANAPALPDLPTSALYPDMGGRSCATRGGKTRRCSP